MRCTNHLRNATIFKCNTQSIRSIRIKNAHSNYGLNHYVHCNHYGYTWLRRCLSRMDTHIMKLGINLVILTAPLPGYAQNYSLNKKDH